MNRFILQINEGPVPSGRGHRKGSKERALHNFNSLDERNYGQLWQQSSKENNNPAYTLKDTCGKQALFLQIHNSKRAIRKYTAAM